MDVKSKEDRSKNMAAIRNQDTKPEIKLRKALFKEGFRYRVRHKLPGKPDIIFPGRKIAIFVDGCFWHGCPYCYKEPSDNKEFWKNKLVVNKKRDCEVNEILEAKGWIVLRFWEHEIKKDIEDVVSMIKRSLN